MVFPTAKETSKVPYSRIPGTRGSPVSIPGLDPTGYWEGTAFCRELMFIHELRGSSADWRRAFRCAKGEDIFSTEGGVCGIWE